MNKPKNVKLPSPLITGTRCHVTKEAEIQQNTLDASKLTRSVGIVNIYRDGDDEVALPFYNGCVYVKKNQFISIIQNFCFDESNRYEVELPCLMEPIEAKIIHRDPDSGISIFEMPAKKCRSLIPLIEETELVTQWGDEVFIADGNRGMYVTPVKVCPFDGLLFLEIMLDERDYGCPILNSQGNLLGLVINQTHVSEKKIDKVAKVWKPVEDRTKRLKRLLKLSKMFTSIASAIPMDNVPCKFEAE